MNETITTTTSYPDSRLFRQDFPAGADTAVSGLLARTAFWLVAGFLVISTFEGALRFYAAQVGLPWIVYVKDLMLMGAVTAGVVDALHRHLRNLPLMVVLAFMTMGTAVGLYIIPDARQPLFAAKTWLPLLCGTAVAPLIDPRSRAMVWVCGLVWSSAVAGILVTSFWRAPWEGFVYDVGGISVEGSREWMIGDVRRVAGFSRASFDAALQCLFFGAVLVASLRRYALGLLVWLVSAAGLYLALSRSAMIALAAASLLHVMTMRYRVLQRTAKLVTIALALGMVAIPFAAGYYYKNKATVAKYEVVISTSSFEERATKTWPEGLALATRGGTWLAGRGLGGIGAAQQFFETDAFNPGDNVFIYLWGSFGAFGGAFIAFIVLQIWRTRVPLSKRRQAALMLVGSFLAVGLTLNGLEAAIASLFFGMALVWLTDSSGDSQETAP